MQPLLTSIFDAVLNGDANTASAAVEQALAAGLEPTDILSEAMVAAMTEVGRLFTEGEYFVPEMLVAARAMQAGMMALKPRLIQSEYKPVARVAIGTVKGDLHDIGKNLVAMMLEGASFEIVDLGTDAPPEKFVAAVQEQAVDIIAMSALLTTTMPNMRLTIEALEAAGIRRRVKVMVGGAPITEAYAREIGADGYSPDASRAVALAHTLVNR